MKKPKKKEISLTNTQLQNVLDIAKIAYAFYLAINYLNINIDSKKLKKGE